MGGDSSDRAGNEPGDDRPDGRMEELIAARLALLAAAYPTLVNDASRELIRSEIAGSIDRDARLRTYRLGNGDEPVAGFRPYRAADPGNGA